MRIVFYHINVIPIKIRSPLSFIQKGAFINMENNYLSIVKKFADNVLENGKDVFNDPPSPLLADVLVIDKDIPYRQNAQVTKTAKGNHEVISSNLLYQQQFLRTLKMLSVLTGDSSYYDHAKKTIKYYYDNLIMKSGRMPWGNHHDIDLLTLRDNGDTHEIKCQYPFYDLMYEVDELKTSRMIKAFWRGHIINRNTFDLSRHAVEVDRFGHSPHTTEGLDEYFEAPIPDVPPFTAVEGLTFLNTASDLTYAALKYYQHTGDINAIKWSEALNGMYLKHRHPKTGIDSYMYGINIGYLHSNCGDRGIHQMFSEFGPSAYEGHVMKGGAQDNYGGHLQCLAEFHKYGGEIGKNMFKEGVKGAETFLHYALDPDDCTWHGMLSDGTDLTGITLKKEGYFGREAPKCKVDPSQIIAFLKGAYYAKSTTLWDYTRKILKTYVVGDIGKELGDTPTLNYDCTISDSLYVACMYLLNDMTGKEQFLDLADKIVANSMAEQWNDKGYFKSGRRPELCEIDTFTPFTMLCLEAHRQGKADQIPDVLYCSRLSSFSR